METIVVGSDKKGLDRYTELIWRGFFEKEFKEIVGKKVVDMGCGNGRYTGVMSKCNEYYGVDIDENATMLTMVSYVESISLPDECVDEVIAIGVLDYSEPYSTIREVYRILKHGGRFRFMVPNTMCPYHLLRVLFDRGYKKTFMWGELIDLVLEGGFHIEFHHEDGFCFYVPFGFLQEFMIPVYLFLNGFFGSMMGNNIYIRAVKR
jgi:SAM-dependent methyltransferase